MKKLYLISNAHLDPVWQWEWDEGVGAALSTFRSAVEFCEEYDDFIFNHNEVILYKWIESYEPSLFERIKKLVAQGKWHISGGFYLQPDCNMPSGEALIRQITVGHKYFEEKFSVKPTVAINFDAFGHTKGLVQILEKAGYTGYICTRPAENEFYIEKRDFIWRGFNNSEILVHRSDSYNSALGNVDEKINRYISNQGDNEIGLVLWGVGNHGGGPSRRDLDKIKNMQEKNELEIIHSTPEEYFSKLEAIKNNLPVIDTDLNNTMTGCYTSQIKIKQKYRQLENELFYVEKMMSHTANAGVMNYEEETVCKAQEDLLYSQFHDILPGSSVSNVEKTSLRLLDHGLEELSRIKTKAFFALSCGQEKAKEGEYPILVYNPHPYYIKDIIECEFMLADQNWENNFSMPIVYHNNKALPSQHEKENSNVPLDWRKRVVFDAELKPCSMNRFDCKIELLESKPKIQTKPQGNYFVFENSDRIIKININTGLVDSYITSNISFLEQPAFKIMVIEDSCDSWGMNIFTYKNIIGEFTLMSPEETAIFFNMKDTLVDPVRIIEEGEVRYVVEALFKYNNSTAVLKYTIPKNVTTIELSIKLIFNESDKMLKLNIPTTLCSAKYLGKTAFGVNELKTDGSEMIAQDWVALTDGKNAISCINFGNYGSDSENSSINITLIRSSAYCAHTIGDRNIIPKDRYIERMDQGETDFNFIIKATSADNLLDLLDYESVIKHQKPYALSYFPAPEGEKIQPFIYIDNKIIQMTAFKRSDDNNYIMRLYNSSIKKQNSIIESQVFNIKQEISLKPLEFKTFILKKESIAECDLFGKASLL